MDFWYIVLVYYISISIVAVIITIFDKIAAIHKKIRVPENTLMTIAFFGGATAMLITMKGIRHKTRHKKFMIGLPLMIVMHALITGLAYYFLNN